MEAARKEAQYIIEEARAAANIASEELKALRKQLQVIGPSPAGIGKIEDIYRFVFYVKHKDYEKLVQVKDVLEEKVHESNISRVSVQFDFDPVNVL